MNDLTDAEIRDLLNGLQVPTERLEAILEERAIEAGLERNIGPGEENASIRDGYRLGWKGAVAYHRPKRQSGIAEDPDGTPFTWRVSEDRKWVAFWLSGYKTPRKTAIAPGENVLEIAKLGVVDAVDTFRADESDVDRPPKSVEESGS